MSLLAMNAAISGMACCLADSVSDVGRARAATGGFAAATPSPAPASAAR